MRSDDLYLDASAFVWSPEVMLRQPDLETQDVDFLRELFSSPSGEPFRWRGQTPSSEELRHTFWAGMHTAAVGIDRADASYLCLLYASGASERDGHCFIAALSHPAEDRKAAVAQCALLFVDSVFRRWPFRKLSMELDEVSYSSLPSMASMWQEEGLFESHVFRDGAWRDVHRLAITRPIWEDVAAPAIRRIGASYPS